MNIEQEIFELKETIKINQLTIKVIIATLDVQNKTIDELKQILEQFNSTNAIEKQTTTITE